MIELSKKAEAQSGNQKMVQVQFAQNVKHNDERYKKGQKIEVSKDEAEELKLAGVLDNES